MGWLREQIDKAHESFQEWPDWMQDAARFEVSGKVVGVRELEFSAELFDGEPADPTDI